VEVLGSEVDWTQVLLALIAIVPSLVAAYFAFRIHVAVQTPSGDPLGTVAERTHDLSAVSTAMLKDVRRATANGEESLEGHEAAKRG
jgi:hypothetical protein